MATIAVEPLVLKDYTLKIGADNYEAALSQVSLVPSSSTITWSGPIGSDFTDVGPTTWTCQLGYVQDWRTPTSLSRYLLEHEGQTVAAVFEPSSDPDEPAFEVDLIITPGQIGGTTRQFAATTVTLGVHGKPSLVEPV